MWAWTSDTLHQFDARILRLTKSRICLQACGHKWNSTSHEGHNVCRRPHFSMGMHDIGSRFSSTMTAAKGGDDLPLGPSGSDEPSQVWMCMMPRASLYLREQRSRNSNEGACKIFYVPIWTFQFQSLCCDCRSCCIVGVYALVFTTRQLRYKHWKRQFLAWFETSIPLTTINTVPTFWRYQPEEHL